jgi:hypothetical protein
MSAKARTKRDWIWLGRDYRSARDSSVSLYPYRTKPEYDGFWGRWGGMDATTFYYPWFRRITGITLKPGELRKVRITAEVIE